MTEEKTQKHLPYCHSKRLKNCPKKLKSSLKKSWNRVRRDVLLISEWNMLLSFSMFLSRTMQFTHIKIAGVVYGMSKRSILHFAFFAVAAAQLDYFFIFFCCNNGSSRLFYLSESDCSFYFISLDIFCSLGLAAT